MHRKVNKKQNGVNFSIITKYSIFSFPLKWRNENALKLPCAKLGWSHALTTVNDSTCFIFVVKLHVDYILHILVEGLRRRVFHFFTKITITAQNAIDSSRIKSCNDTSNEFSFTAELKIENQRAIRQTRRMSLPQLSSQHDKRAIAVFKRIT
jgi:hypothetical protein